MTSLPPPLYWRTKAASAKLDKSPSKHTSQTGVDTVPNAPDTSPCAAPAARLPPNVPFTVPWSVIRRFARRRRWASGLNGHNLRTTRAQLAGPRYDPWSDTPRFALRRPWPSSLRMRRGTNVAQTPSKTSPRIACATHRPHLAQRSVHRSLVGHPALCTSSTLAVQPANATRRKPAQTPSPRSPRTGRVSPQRSAHQSPVGHPALCTSSTLALKPAKDRHCERQHILPGRQSRLSALRTGRVSPAVPSNVPCRSPSAFHLDDPCPKAWKDDALQTARTRLAGLRHACAAHRLRLPHRSVHRSVVGHPALCTSSTPALVRRIQKVASSMHTRADQSHERDPPPIGNVNKTRPGPARRIHANPP